MPLAARPRSSQEDDALYPYPLQSEWYSWRMPIQNDASSMVIFARLNFVLLIKLNLGIYSFHQCPGSPTLCLFAVNSANLAGEFSVRGE